MYRTEKWLVHCRLIEWMHSRRLGQYLANAPEVTGKALELGCGRGTTSLEVLMRYPKLQLVATDIDPQEIAMAKARLENTITFETADAQKLSYRSNSFDAVFAFDVHHHIEDWRNALAEEYRVLKKGGRLFIQDFGRPPLYHVLYKIFPHTDFTRYEFIQEVQATGFKLENVTQGFVFWLEAIKP